MTPFQAKLMLNQLQRHFLALDGDDELIKISTGNKSCFCFFILFSKSRIMGMDEVEFIY